MRGPDGILLVDKPAGPTSHDVVARVRRGAGMRRVGHTGTLDPFASGLLVLCLGPSTRLAEFFLGMDKAYEATARLGARTDTDDLEGGVLASSEGWREVTRAGVEEALAGLRGRVLQRPPAHSAKKVRGEAAHRRVRRGEEVSLAPVEVEVYELELLSLALPLLHFRVRCSSGTYVRALARELGEALGVGAHLAALRRTAVGHLGVDGAVPFEALEERGRVLEALLSPPEALCHLPRTLVGPHEAARILQGQLVPFPGVEPGPEGPLLVLHGERLLAVAVTRGGLLRPRKVFPDD